MSIERSHGKARPRPLRAGRPPKSPAAELAAPFRDPVEWSVHGRQSWWAAPAGRCACEDDRRIAFATRADRSGLVAQGASNRRPGARAGPC